MINFYRTLILIGCFLLGYLFGSIPNSVIISKIFYHKDPRDYGSHNPGGTNVGRSISKGAGVATMALDFFKVIIPFLSIFALFTYFEPAAQLMLGDDLTYNIFGQGNTLAELTYYLVALGCMFGHAYSCFLGFKGGKIVSTFAGFILATSWTAIPIFAAIFFICLKKTKIVSITSIITTGCITLFSWIVYIVFATCGPTISGYLMFSEFGPHVSIYLPVFFSIGYVLLVFKHRGNLIKLKKGEENKIHWMK